MSNKTGEGMSTRAIAPISWSSVGQVHADKVSSGHLAPEPPVNTCAQHELARLTDESAADPRCTVDGCERAGIARGLCGMHYGRWHRTGDAGEAARRKRGPVSAKGDHIPENRGVPTKQGTPPATKQGGHMTAHQHLTAALGALNAKGARTPCAGRDEWTSDYVGQRREAAAACNGCPILDECAAAANEQQESFGVWAGVDYSQARQRTHTNATASQSQ